MPSGKRLSGVSQPAAQARLVGTQHTRGVEPRHHVPPEDALRRDADRPPEGERHAMRRGELPGDLPAGGATAHHNDGAGRYLRRTPVFVGPPLHN